MKRLTNLREVARKKISSYNTLINVWGDETSYNERYASGDQGVAYRVIMDFDVETDTYPTNPQTLIYAKYKTFLHSYTDDI